GTAGGDRTLTARLDNRGTVTVSANATFGASGVSTNSGTLDVSGGDLTITQAAGGASFTNAATGSFNVAANRTLTITTVPFTNFSGGVLTDGTYNIAGRFRFDNAAIITDAAKVVLAGAASMITDLSVPANDALIALSSVASGSSLSLQG